LKLKRVPSPIPHLHNESQADTQLAQAVAIPWVSWIGCEWSLAIVVFERLRQSLAGLLIARRHLSLKSGFMNADQCLCRIEPVHRKLPVHHDIKPMNTLMDVGDSAQSRTWNRPNRPTEVDSEISRGVSAAAARRPSISAGVGAESH
jgi:hypothetical protein